MGKRPSGNPPALSNLRKSIDALLDETRRGAGDAVLGGRAENGGDRPRRDMSRASHRSRIWCTARGRLSWKPLADIPRERASRSRDH